MTLELFRLYEKLREEGIVFCFSGAISQGILEGIGEALRQKMELEDMPMGTIQRVFGILVELMQNIVNYSAERLPEEDMGRAELRFGILTVGREGRAFFVRCGNFVAREHVEELAERVRMLQGMTKDELKALYRERRKAGPGAGSKGARLGLIDIARKAARPPDFNITEVDDKRAFFSMKVVIGEE